MKLVSRFEAASRSTAELHALLAEAFNAFANAPRSSQERHDALPLQKEVRHAQLYGRHGSPFQSLQGLVAVQKKASPTLSSF